MGGVFRKLMLYGGKAGRRTADCVHFKAAYIDFSVFGNLFVNYALKGGSVPLCAVEKADCAYIYTLCVHRFAAFAQSDFRACAAYIYNSAVGISECAEYSALRLLLARENADI